MTASPARNLPVSDAERDHIGTLLQRAVGRGTLTLAEFTDRMDTVLAATTRAELNALVIDLPGIRMVNPEMNGNGHQPPESAGTPSWYAPDLTADGVLMTELQARMAGLSRSGPWRVPDVLRLDSRFSHVELDFTEADVRTQIVELVVNDICSTVTLIVPPFVTVDTSQLTCSTGSTITNDANPGPPPGRFHLAVVGRLHFGTFTVHVALGHINM